MAGVKPLGIECSLHKEATPDGGRRSFGDDPAKVKDFLDSLGLVSTVEVLDGRITSAVFALRQETLDAYRQGMGDRSVGILFGYPPTAVEAFGTEDAMSPDKQDAIENAAGLDGYFVPFFMSKQHWRDELAIAKRWYDVLKAYDLLNELDEG